MKPCTTILGSLAIGLCMSFALTQSERHSFDRGDRRYFKGVSLRSASKLDQVSIPNKINPKYDIISNQNDSTSMKQHRVLKLQLAPVDSIADINEEFECGLSYLYESRRRKRYVKGGFETTLYDYPSYKRLEITLYNGSDYIYTACGSTLIHSQYLLTAIHCVNILSSYKPQRVIVHSTSFRWKKKEDPELRVATICNLPENIHDVSLLKLTKPVKFTQTIQPACLPDFLVSTSEPLVGVGFGGYNSTLEKLGIPQQTPNLQELPLNRYNCEPWFNKPSKPRACFKPYDARYMGRGCAGDSGGPIYADIEDAQTVVSVIAESTVGCDNKPGKLFGGNLFAIKDQVLKTMADC